MLVRCKNAYRVAGHKVGEKNSPSFPGFSRAIIIPSRGYRNKIFGDLAPFRAIFSDIFTVHAQKWLF